METLDSQVLRFRAFEEMVEAHFFVPERTFGFGADPLLRHLERMPSEHLQFSVEMAFRNVVQSRKSLYRGGYLSQLESTFADSERESGMAYWERLQLHGKVQHEHSEEEEEEAYRRLRRRKPQRSHRKMIEQSEVFNRMPRLYESRQPKLFAPKEQVFELLTREGFIGMKGRAGANLRFLELEDEEIVAYYAEAAKAILDYYKCCDNLKEIKPYVDYHLRFSCMFTLSKKYKKHPQEIYKMFSKELLIPVEENGRIVEKQCYPSSHEVKKMMRGFSRKSLLDIFCAIK